MKEYYPPYYSVQATKWHPNPPHPQTSLTLGAIKEVLLGPQRLETIISDCVFLSCAESTLLNLYKNLEKRKKVVRGDDLALTLPLTDKT